MLKKNLPLENKAELKHAITSQAPLVTTRKPAYQRIKDSILKDIHTGKWQAGDMIPTEHSLAKSFGVSRMTVNRALKELSEDKVLQRRQGSGTFVAQQKYNHTLVEVRNIAADIKANKKQYEAKVISKVQVPTHEVDPSILARFSEPVPDTSGVDSSKHLFYNTAHQFNLNCKVMNELKVVHIADGQPIQLEERWVDASLIPDFIKQDFTKTNSSDYLIAKVPLEGGRYNLEAVAAPKEVAEALNIAVNDCVLLFSRQTYSSGQVISFVKMWHAGTRYQFSGEM